MTDRQEECLLIFAERDREGRCISSASEILGVSKATISHLSVSLERQGYVRKSRYGEVELTDLGRAHVAPQLEKMQRLEKWLEISLGLSPKTAEQEARRMVISMAPEIVDGIIRLGGTDLNVPPPEQANGFFEALRPGTYQVPFRLCKTGTGECSMGDRGFRKPAILVRSETSCAFLLYPVKLQYRTSLKSHIYTGELKRLWRRSGGSWYEVPAQEDGGYSLPASAVRCEEGPEGRMGHVHVRVRTTVSLVKMPESEADLVFRLDQIQPFDNMDERSDRV